MEPGSRDSIPKAMPVLRAAVEEVLRSRWDDVFRRRALEIAAAFEESLRASGRPQSAAVASSIALLLEIEPREVIMLGKHLDEKLHELLGKLESRLNAQGEVESG